MMVRTFPLTFGIFRIGNKSLAALTIPTFVARFIDMRLQFFPNFLAAFLVFFVCSSNKVCIFDAEFLDEILEFLRILIHKLLYGNT